jgi:hypothetical protein
VHSTLLAAGIPICEHLTGLEALPASGFRFNAVPVKVRGMGTFPVRAYAALGGGSRWLIRVVLVGEGCDGSGGRSRKWLSPDAGAECEESGGDPSA